MKPTMRNTLVAFGGFAVATIGLLDAPLGLPNWTLPLGSAVLAACFILISQLHKRDKKRGLVAPVADPNAQNRKITFYLLLGLFLACVTSPFTDEYIGHSLPFWSRVVISVVTFIVLAPLIVILRRRHEKT